MIKFVNLILVSLIVLTISIPYCNAQELYFEKVLTRDGEANLSVRQTIQDLENNSYNSRAKKVVTCYSDGMEMFNNGFNPPKDWIIAWADKYCLVNGQQFYLDWTKNYFGEKASGYMHTKAIRLSDVLAELLFPLIMNLWETIMITFKNGSKS